MLYSLYLCPLTIQPLVGATNSNSWSPTSSLVFCRQPLPQCMGMCPCVPGQPLESQDMRGPVAKPVWGHRQALQNATHAVQGAKSLVVKAFYPYAELGVGYGLELAGVKWSWVGEQQESNAGVELNKARVYTVGSRKPGQR